MRVGAIIQARMSSSRLPGKVLKELPYGSGISALEQVVKRVRQSEILDDVIVATSEEKSDDPIFSLCSRIGISVFRGSLLNVLERYYKTANEYNLDIVVRITGDCPCLDSDVLDWVINQHIDQQADFSTISAFGRTFPKGIDVGVISFKALEEAFHNAVHDFEKEHVTPYIFRSNPDKFKILALEAIDKWRFPDLRLTLDTIEDYVFLCMIYDNLYNDAKLFGLDEVLELIKRKPFLLEVNKSIEQKKLHEDLNSELDEVKAFCKRQDLLRAYNFISSI